MEFAAGQVFNIGKLTEHFKKTKEKKEAQLRAKESRQLFDMATAECEQLRQSLDYLCDKDLLEANIYRLKAAELIQNRRIRMAKEHNLTS